jgi:hypothetical protein
MSEPEVAALKVAILVPRRDGVPDRDATWAWCRAWWREHFPDWPVVEGHHEVGPFNRAAAINTAARKALGADVFLIVDSDAFCDPRRIREAVEMAHTQDRMVLPFRTRKDLNDAGAQKIMGGFTGNWDRPRLWYRTYVDMVSTIVAVSRRLFELTGGFDEAFRGWGWEDNAFAAMCETFGSGPVHRIEGDAWHLWHAPAPEVGRQHPLNRANHARYQLYQAAKGNPERMRALRQEPVELEHDGRIPRVIHRVVPAVTHPLVERWWDEFAALHPGWRLMTHRDPLDPADWPLTSPVWRHLRSGAALADLVRLEALLRYGGFYVDSDMQPFRSLDPLRVAGAVAAWEDDKVIPNAFLGAPPEHNAIRECLELAVRRAPKGDVWKAGPGVTTEILAGRDDTIVLPPDSIFGVHYRDPDRDAKMRAFDPAQHPWAYMLHWYAASWLPAQDQHPLPEEVVAA